MKQYLKEIKDFSTLTFDEEQELFKLVSLGNNNAREKLIKHNLPLVLYIGNKYISIVNYEEIISTGNEILIKCIDNFDYTKKYKFNTYAFPFIKGAIINLIKTENKFKFNEIEDIQSEEDNFFNYDKSFITKLLSILDEKEKYLFVQYYGNNKTYDEVGEKYGMKRNLTKYYIDRILIKLRNKMNNSNIKRNYGY